MEYKSRAVVVIPVYKEVLDVYERVSLMQVRRKLNRYEMRFVAPQGLQMRYGELGADIKVEWFSASFFKSKHMYSRLLLSPEFYDRFSDFEYMLIYQLDAFVFSDQLDVFCKQGYDYIGAPVSRLVSVWSNLKKRVGNGGFSLRKVCSCRALCQRKDEIFAMQPDMWDENQFLLWEDIFFAFAGGCPELDFRTPEYDVAQSFSVEHEGRKVYKKICGGWRPFGCHAWEYADYWFWKPFIESFGYELPEGNGIQMVSRRTDLLGSYAIRRSMRCDNVTADVVFPILKGEISIWGMGSQGRLCYRFVKSIGIEVKCIYEDGFIVESVSEPILRPTDALILGNGCPIVVATIKYEVEISERLDHLGLKIGKDYFLWRNLKDIVLTQLRHKLFRKSGHNL